MSAAQTVTLNTNGTLSITLITTSAQFAQTNTCGNSVSAGGNCTISVTFVPTSAGASTGALTITDSASNSPEMVTLTGTGTAPVVSLTPPSLTFASQLFRTTSAAQTVTLTNSGDAPLIINGIAASGDFAQTNNCGGSVAPSASCSVSITFIPTADGARTGAIAITDNAAGSPQMLTLSGTGLAPVVSLSPASLYLYFTAQIVGTTSTAQPLTLTNSGGAALTINGVSASGDFRPTNSCPASLASQASCTMSVAFTPTAAGTRAGSVTITDNAPDSPQTVTLGGTGILGPLLTVSPTSLTFPAQYVGTSGLPMNVTLQNTGDQNVAISNVQASSSFGETNGFPSPIPAGTQCTIGVFFDPTASGNINGALTITDSAPGSPHTVSLLGTGQDFNFAPAPGSSTSTSVAAGQMAIFSLVLSPGGGFNQTVTLACTGAPMESSCAATPGTVTLNPNGPTTVTISIATTASSMVGPRTRLRPPAADHPRGLPALLWLAALCALATLALAGRMAQRMRPASRAALALLAVIVLLGPVLLSCGGGGSVVHHPGTPTGTYTLNVAAKFASGTVTLTHNVQLTLTVD